MCNSSFIFYKGLKLCTTCSTKFIQANDLNNCLNVLSLKLPANFCHGSVSQHIVPIFIVNSEFMYDVMQLFYPVLSYLLPRPQPAHTKRRDLITFLWPVSLVNTCCFHNKYLRDFIGHSMLLELAQRFELVTPDPFSWCKLGGVWARCVLGLTGSGLWDYFHIFSHCRGNDTSP